MIKPIKEDQSIISYLFYLYFALLPLLAFMALYFEKDIWLQFTHFIDIQNSIAYFSYHVFCAVTFFVSSVLSIIIVQNTAIPANKLLSLLIIFDAPVLIFIDYITGHKISLAEMIMYDFVLEVIALTIANFIISLKRKNNILMINIYGVALVLSFYGTVTFNLLKEASLKTIFIFILSVVGASYGYFRILKNGGTGNSKSGTVQIKMSQLATVAMIALWAFMAYVYGKILFFTNFLDNF